MAERTHIPSSPACGEWEMLLADALDGLLKPEDEAKFTAHKAACPACAALYEEARKGREWLEFLSPEPEAPEGLLEKILAHTGPGHAAPTEWTAGGALPAVAGTAVPDFMPPIWQQPGFFARVRAMAQPRLLMTAAGAFFSIALTLNMMGVRLTDMRLSDLRPEAMRSYMERQWTMASVPIVRYYDHLRFVYEVKSKVRELRQETGEGSGEPQHNEIQPVTPGETKQNPGKNPGGSDGGWRADPRQGDRDQETKGAKDRGRERREKPAMEPANGEFVEASFHVQGKQHMQSGNSAVRARERSRVWIA